jgi:hypothetical protein
MKHEWEPFVDEEPPEDTYPYEWLRRCERCGTPMTTDNEDGDCSSAEPEDPTDSSAPVSP